MSADKTVMVGTMTDPRYGTVSDPSSRRYVLRIYQVINPNVSDYPDDLVTPITYDMSRPFHVQRFTTGSSIQTSYGTMTMDQSAGVLSYLSYHDNGSNSLPAASYYIFTTIPSLSKAISPSLGAILTNPGSTGYSADQTFYGKVSRYSYMTVFTKTETSGDVSLSIGMQKPQ